MSDLYGTIVAADRVTTLERELAESRALAEGLCARVAELAQELQDANRACEGRADERDILLAEIDVLKQPPDVESWKQLVAYAYRLGGDGARHIERITAEYNSMRERATQAEAIREAREVSVQHLLAERDERLRDTLALNVRAKKAEAEAAELQASFDLRWKADMRAIKRWRGCDPAKALTMPDHADLCVWLLEECERTEALADMQDKALQSAVGREAHVALAADRSALLDFISNLSDKFKHSSRFPHPTVLRWEEMHAGDALLSELRLLKTAVEAGEATLRIVREERDKAIETSRVTTNMLSQTRARLQSQLAWAEAERDTERQRVESLDGALATSNAAAKRRGEERDIQAAGAAALREALESIEMVAGGNTYAAYSEDMNKALLRCCGIARTALSTTVGADLLARLAKLEAENASLRNQAGDNLCWIKDDEDRDIAQALTWPEMQESCRRYHAQISAVTGEYSGGMTIAQLEQKVAEQKAELDRIGRSSTQTDGAMPPLTRDQVDELYRLRKSAEEASSGSDVKIADRRFANAAYSAMPALLAAVAQVSKPRMCSTCCGSPLPSVRNCICGGIGTEAAEIDGLRRECNDGSLERDRLLALVAGLGATVDTLRAALDAYGSHAENCYINWKRADKPEYSQCDCGLAKLLSETEGE